MQLKYDQGFFLKKWDVKRFQSVTPLSMRLKQLDPNNVYSGLPKYTESCTCQHSCSDSAPNKRQ